MSSHPRSAVLMLHGTAPGTTAAANFAGLTAALPDHHVMAPDLLGFGTAPKPRDVTYGPALWTDQAWQLLDDADIADVTVIGNSMGARVALDMAEQRPDRIRGLVLLSPRLHPSRSHAQDLLRAYIPNSELMHQLVVECFATSPDSVTPELVQSRYEASALPGAHEALQSMFATMAHDHAPWNEARLRAVHLPATVVAGEADRVVPSSNAHAVAAALPHADLHVLGGTGHWFLQERAELFTAVVQEFLARTD